MTLEEKAIAFILRREPNWKQTSPNNPGFDLLRVGSDGQPEAWCEVKAMKSSLDERPVGLSRAQFKCAQEHGDNYWLYVVEHADSDEPHLVRIQDPVGKARTFTFDQGWRAVAEHEGPEPRSGEETE